MHPRPTPSRARHGTAALVVAALAALGLAACSRGSGGSEQAARIETVPIVVEPVEFVPQRTHLEAVGTSRAERSATIYPAAAGEVVAVHFRPGQYVKQGDVLVELAKVALADAERQYDRYRRMEGSGAVVPATLDAARAARTRFGTPSTA